jgi:hypothetical protein
MLLSLHARCFRFATPALIAAMAILGGTRLSAQAALLLEQPYGVFGALNPTGHAAIFVEHVCADSPVHLRPCEPGETGVVISRYKGIAGYDWLAIPLIPYLYAVDDAAMVPAHVDVPTVDRMRAHYRESHLAILGDDLPPGNFFSGGWTELVGTAYDRRTYAFRFATTPEQDRDLIAHLNERENRSHFNIFYNNCADFDRFILNHYFPKQFRRMIFPDAGITTPKHVTHRLVTYAKHHPEAQMSIFLIPQVPGYRRQSRSIHGVTESFLANGYVLPVMMIHPYVAGGLIVDYLLRGLYRDVPKNPESVDAAHMEALLEPTRPITDPDGASQARLTPSRLTPVAQANENAPTFVSIPEADPNGKSVMPPQSLEPFMHP